MKPFSLILIIFVVIVLWLTERPNQLKTPLPFKERGDAELALQVLSQPLHFFASGGQTDVYVSEDGKYVVKFFKNTPRPWIPFARYQERKLRKLKRDLGAYALAFDQLQKESALIFLAASSSKELIALLPGRRLSLKNIPFVIQRKGVPLKEYLNETNKKEALEAITHLIQKRSEYGIGDDDPRLEQNIGFIEDTPFFLDPGRFVQEPFQQSLLPARFTSWCENSFASS